MPIPATTTTATTAIASRIVRRRSSIDGPWLTDRGRSRRPARDEEVVPASDRGVDDDGPPLDALGLAGRGPPVVEPAALRWRRRDSLLTRLPRCGRRVVASTADPAAMRPRAREGTVSRGIRVPTS